MIPPFNKVLQSREDYIEFHKWACELMVEITRRKNHDYSRVDNPFANFEIVGALGLSIEQGFITRMSDKLSRISNFIQQQKLLVEDETVEDTLFDLANYSILLAGYLRYKRAKLEKQYRAQQLILQDDKRIAEIPSTGQIGAPDIKLS